MCCGHGRQQSGPSSRTSGHRWAIPGQAEAQMLRTWMTSSTLMEQTMVQMPSVLGMLSGHTSPSAEVYSARGGLFAM